MSAESFYTYHPDGISFTSKFAAGIKTLYAPLCGVDALGLKSAITPFLSGDIKLDKFHYLTKPASREDLRMPLRAFFVSIKDKGMFNLFHQISPASSKVSMGPLWHEITCTDSTLGLECTVVNFIPVDGSSVELMQISVKNTSQEPMSLIPTVAMALFGRSLANKHDHEHVTALLNRVTQVPQGVFMQATMAFNEEGHKPAGMGYFVYGIDGRQEGIAGSFPTVDSFYGDEGSIEDPVAVRENREPCVLAPDLVDGKEVVGALRFRPTTLASGQSQSFIVMAGMACEGQESLAIFENFNTPHKFHQALERNQQYWLHRISSIGFSMKDGDFNAWMRWVTLQPILRRIFGCSFLPDHDYGKGGRGWRDIWQDLLSLILIEPQSVRQDLINNCAGIRIDGSNATIIGAKQGEFLADRNAITRVWMDHGAWPFLTVRLYIDQSGDFDILLHKQGYFRDPQLSRTHEKDLGWNAVYGHQLIDKKGHGYQGTILEHLLVEHLTQFFNVGEHNIIRLESADWNDGLDMAAQKGESVAFTSLYGGNLLNLADLLEDMARVKGLDTVTLARELLILLDTLSERVNYDDPRAKHNLLFGKYFHNVQPVVSGETVVLAIKDVVRDLRAKGHWIFAHIRRQEKIQQEYEGQRYAWFNGYYDNKAQRVEGLWQDRVRMTLTGQVFAIMSGMAHADEIKAVVASVEQFLRDKTLGGYRLNTDFGLPHYLDLGRAFGFAYGTKENGAFFSHMNVMYATALYQRGFARAGYEVIQSIYRMASDGHRSKIYPGIPEYFDGQGRGMYPYLTGSASWLVLTELLHVFGVRGFCGDLILAPQLVKEEFNDQHSACVSCQFAGHRVAVVYYNPQQLDAGAYEIQEVSIDNKPFSFEHRLQGKVCIPRTAITQDVRIKVLLG